MLGGRGPSLGTNSGMAPRHSAAKKTAAKNRGPRVQNDRTKLTAETRETIALLIRAGNTVDIAAEAVGISKRTFHNWMNRGEIAPPGDALRLFFDAVEAARDQAEASQVATVAQAARNGSWRASAWLLERRWPERWAKATDRARITAAW